MCFNTLKRERKREARFRNNVMEKIVKLSKDNALHFYSAEELEEAITLKRGDKRRILSGYHFDLYHGLLNNGNIGILVKKYNMYHCDYDMVYNDIYVGSQMKGHRNVSNILGICYVGKQDDLVITVYEFVNIPRISPSWPITTLVHCYSDMTWESRLRVGKDIADTISYAHSKDIILRYIPMSTIVVTSENVTKIIDFSIALPIPKGCSHVDEKVQQIIHYDKAPEQLGLKAKPRVTKETDVYHLGLLLLYLILPKSGLSDFPGRPENLPLKQVVDFYKKHSRKNIVDPELSQVHPDHLLSYVRLGFNCLRMIEERADFKAVQETLTKFVNGEFPEFQIP